MQLSKANELKVMQQVEREVGILPDESMCGEHGKQWYPNELKVKQQVEREVGILPDESMCGEHGITASMDVVP